VADVELGSREDPVFQPVAEMTFRFLERGLGDLKESVEFGWPKPCESFGSVTSEASPQTAQQRTSAQLR
jgi:hypothetical protein